MTLPLQAGSPKSKKNWLDRYIQEQARLDVRVRTALLEASKDAEKRIEELADDPIWSAGVRRAQIKLVVDVVKDINRDVFGKILNLLTPAQKKAAELAVDAFAVDDRKYLEQAFSQLSKEMVQGFIDGQKTQAKLQVANAINTVNKTRLPLSKRVYRSEALANQWVAKAVTSAVLQGKSPKELAMSVRQMIRPNVPGGVSYAAMRLARTELNNAFHATSIEIAKDRPWVISMRWNLSKIHVHQECICEQYAYRGLFPVEDIPGKPHPHCMCYVTPELEPFESFKNNLLAGNYRDWTYANVS